ncbi:MAG: CHAP domain-containing protein [Prevotellaceae bacterium]|jgi:surface antigen|nr:CHAP domain-containing protein [Prevotellaceae bacterium]
MKIKHCIYLLIALLFLAVIGLWTIKHVNLKTYTIGQPIDSLNGVYVYYNGKVSNVSGRNITADGYNIGKKYQCVEFVKRYYYEYLNHKMPDSYGNAIDFFDSKLKDGQKNKQRNLTQYHNPSQTKPKVGDLLIFKGTVSNKYGHVAIVSKVTDRKIEIIQQNPGKSTQSRETISINRQGDKWQIKKKRIIGWLRKD